MMAAGSGYSVKIAMALRSRSIAEVRVAVYANANQLQTTCETYGPLLPLGGRTRAEQRAARVCRLH